MQGCFFFRVAGHKDEVDDFLTSYVFVNDLLFVRREGGMVLAVVTVKLFFFSLTNVVISGDAFQFLVSDQRIRSLQFEAVNLMKLASTMIKIVLSYSLSSYLTWCFSSYYDSKRFLPHNKLLLSKSLSEIFCESYFGVS